MPLGPQWQCPRPCRAQAGRARGRDEAGARAAAPRYTGSSSECRLNIMLRTQRQRRVQGARLANCAVPNRIAKARNKAAARSRAALQHFLELAQAVHHSCGAAEGGGEQHGRDTRSGSATSIASRSGSGSCHARPSAHPPEKPAMVSNWHGPQATCRLINMQPRKAAGTARAPLKSTHPRSRRWPQTDTPPARRR